MKRFSRERVVVVSVAAGALGVAYVWSAPGTLTPPAGPIEGTGVTLAALSDKIDALTADLSSLRGEVAGASGPWQRWTGQISGNQVSPLLIAGGAVHLHSVVYYNVDELRFFNGSDGSDLIASLISATSSSGGMYVFSAETHFDVRLENGLYMNWSSGAGNGRVTVLYRELAPE